MNNFQIASSRKQRFRSALQFFCSQLPVGSAGAAP